jgi:hypothetical protein
MPPIHISPIMMNKKTLSMIVFCCNKLLDDPLRYDKATYLLSMQNIHQLFFIHVLKYQIISFSTW